MADDGEQPPGQALQAHAKRTQRRAARARFGKVLRLKERGHDVRSTPALEDVVRDIKHMGRGLRKSPGFTIAVVLTLAVGIGA